MRLKIGDLVSWAGSSGDSPGMVVKVYKHKVWRTDKHGTKVDWTKIDPEPFADVAFGGVIKRLPQSDLKKLNHESR